MRTYYGNKDRLNDQIFPNRAFDRAALVDWVKTETDIKAKLWSGSDRVHWYCPELFVHPDHYKAGYGPLLQWGFDRGRIDEVGCFAGCQMTQMERYEAEGMKIVMHFRCGPSEGLIVRKI